MMAWALKFWTNKSGATAIEYGLIATLVSLALFGSLKQYYNALDATYSIVIANVTKN